MSHVFPRHALANPPIAASGDGCYIIDTEGKRYLDACGGAAVSCLGHSDPDVVAAIKAQADAIPYAHTGFFSSQTSIDLAELLIANAPGDIDKVYFVAGGSEAIETALKLTRQYFLETGQPSRSKFIARWQSYHGNTLGALAAGGWVARFPENIVGSASGRSRSLPIRPPRNRPCRYRRAHWR